MPRGRKRKIAFVPQPWIGNSSSEDEPNPPLPERRPPAGRGHGGDLGRGHGGHLGRRLPGVGRGDGIPFGDNNYPSIVFRNEQLFIFTKITAKLKFNIFENKNIIILQNQ